MTLEQVEEKRIKYKNKLLTVIGIDALVLILMLFSGMPQLVVFALVAMVFITIIVTLKPREEYTKAYKEYFVLRSLNEVFSDVEYKPESGIPRETIASTKMMYMGDTYSSNDLVVAKYKGVNLIQADVHIQEEVETTDSNGNTTTTYVTIFMGRWMIFDFNKPFKANIQVAQKGFGNNRVSNGLFAKKEQLYKKVSMESEMFNKRFNVYAQSEHEAFYILTPSLMEKIQRLDDNNTGRILLCFIDNRLHIGLYDSKDSFEPCSCFNKIDENNELNKINKDIKTITQFVDELSLDNDLFRREVN